MCDDAVRFAASPNAEAGPVALSRREREVGVLAAQGPSDREIAERLFISRRTTENHLARMYEKFGISSMAKFVRRRDGGTAGVCGIGAEGRVPLDRNASGANAG